MRKIRFFMLFLVILISCHKHREEPAWNNAATERESGGVIALWLIRNEETEAYPLCHGYDYGMLVIWTEKNKAFYLYDNIKKKFFETSDFNIFLRELDRLPHDIKVHWIIKCQTGFAPAMPEDAGNKIQKILKSGNRESETPLICCTCEGAKLLFPYAHWY